MKRIKLFENFDTNNPLDVRDDIKTILYELEDDGYDVRFLAKVKPVGGYVEIDALDSSTDVDLFILWVTLPYDRIEPAYSSGSIKTDVERFLLLLRDHLDYINPKNIRLDKKENGLSNSITVKL